MFTLFIVISYNVWLQNDAEKHAFLTPPLMILNVLFWTVWCQPSSFSSDKMAQCLLWDSVNALVVIIQQPLKCEINSDFMMMR